MDNPFGAGEATSTFEEGPIHNILICRECQEDPPNLVEEFSAGDVVCASCGLVLSDRTIDTRSEWRTFANDEAGHDDPNRVGDAGSELLNGSQLGTAIGSTEPGKSRAAKDLYRAQNKTVDAHSKSNKHLLTAYKEIEHYCDTIQAGRPILDATKHIFKLVDDAKFLKGKPQEAIIAGCLFIACRQCDLPRTFREIFNLTRVTKKEIGRVFKALESFITKHNKGGGGHTNIAHKASTTAEELCGRYCSQLGFTNPHAFEMAAKELAVRSANVRELSGRSPLSIAAACIFMTSHLLGQAKSSKSIASVAGVSDGTIKSAYKLLYNSRQVLVDPTSPAFVNHTRVEGKPNAKAADKDKKKRSIAIEWSMDWLPSS